MSRTSALPPKFDALDPELRENPYPAYARLREAGALCRGGPGQWVVTRYSDVASLLGDPRLGSQFPEEYQRFSVGDGPAREFLQRIVLHNDRPHHSRLRALLRGGLERGTVRRLTALIPQLVDLLLAPAQERGYLEAVEDLALPLPVLVVCELLGVPPGDRDEVRPRAFDLGKAFATSVLGDDRRRANEAVTWLREYMSALLEERRTAPRDDLLSQMLAVQRGAKDLTRDEIVDNAIFLFFAGFETTTSLLSTGCAALVEHPDAQSKLRTDPSLIPLAVEEFLRYDAPIQSRLRLVMEPVVIDGRTIKPGRVLLLLIGSANHDSARFEHPERLDVTRSPNPHLSFGGGIHFCLGAALARIEAAVAFDRLLRRFPLIEARGRPTRELDGAFRSFSSVPVTVRGAA